MRENSRIKAIMNAQTPDTYQYDNPDRSISPNDTLSPLPGNINIEVETSSVENTQRRHRRASKRVRKYSQNKEDDKSDVTFQDSKVDFSNQKGKFSQKYNEIQRPRDGNNYLSTQSDGDTAQESLNNLLRERAKITSFLVELNYFNAKEVQTDINGEISAKSSKGVDKSTQRPTQEDIINEIVNTVETRTVAQTQLNLLIEALENLQRDGVIPHMNLGAEDLDLIKNEMKDLLLEKAKIEQQD